MPPPSLINRFLGLFASPADRRLAAAEATGPFTPEPQASPRIPPPAYGADQPVPPPEPPRFDPGYHGYTFRNTAAPLSFAGFTLPRARAAIEMHDTGTSFLESYMLAIATTRHPAVYTALGVRCAPSIALPRKVTGGPRGLSRRVTAEVEDQLARRDGLQPSPYFPSTLWGSIEIELAMMGFAALQHVYGKPDARGVRRIYTRRWPTWATWRDPSRRVFQAITQDGNVDILNDGKFTLIGKTDEPHFQGAVRALMAPTLDATQVQQARAQWIDRFSDPKFIGYMPEGHAVRSPEGDAFFACLQTLKGPGGFGALPHGSSFQAVGLDSKASTSFKDALESDNAYISAILTGTDLTAGDNGVYKSPMFWGILRSTVGDDLAAQKRGINQGHVYPFTRFNYQAGIEEDMARGTWVDPVLDVPLPDPEADARMKSYAERCKLHAEIIQARWDAGLDPTKDDSERLAERLEIVPPNFVGRPITRDHVEQKIVAPDEARKRLGFEALPDGAGSADRLAEERAAGKDKTGSSTWGSSEGVTSNQESEAA